MYLDGLRMAASTERAGGLPPPDESHVATVVPVRWRPGFRGVSAGFGYGPGAGGPACGRGDQLGTTRYARWWTICVFVNVSLKLPPVTSDRYLLGGLSFAKGANVWRPLCRLRDSRHTATARRFNADVHTANGITNYFDVCCAAFVGVPRRGQRCPYRPGR
jgi:hypothetical protein